MSLKGIAAWVRWRGRLARRSFLARASVAIAVFVILFVFLDRMIGYDSTLALYPPFFAVMASLAVRRLHDQARSAAWLLVVLVPVLGPLILGWRLLLTPGTTSSNEYGDDPRTGDRDYLQVTIHEPA